MRFSQHAVAMTILAVLLVSCSSTTLTKSWKDPAYRGQIRKVYIVGVTKLDINRYDFEDVFSQKLQAQGVGAIASYKDSDIPVDIDEQMIIERALAKGADSVLMARLVDRYTQEVTSQPVYYSNWGGYYDNRFQSIYVAPSTVEFDIATIEAKLFDAKSGNVIWSGHLELLVEPAALETNVSDFVKTVSEDLQKKGLL